jgi:hypothetical protein
VIRKTIALLLAVTMVGLLGTSAAAGKKKKPKPYKSETVSVGLGHPVFNGQSGSVVSVTGQEFIARCSIPSSNGFDGYVFEVPKDYRSIVSAIKLKGSNALVPPHDLDIYLFDESCALTVAYNTETADESGLLPKGTAFIFIHNYAPGPADALLTLTP